MSSQQLPKHISTSQPTSTTKTRTEASHTYIHSSHPFTSARTTPKATRASVPDIDTVPRILFTLLPPSTWSHLSMLDTSTPYTSPHAPSPQQHHSTAHQPGPEHNIHISRTTRESSQDYHLRIQSGTMGSVDSGRKVFWTDWDWVGLGWACYDGFFFGVGGLEILA